MNDRKVIVTSGTDWYRSTHGPAALLKATARARPSEETQHMTTDEDPFRGPLPGDPAEDVPDDPIFRDLPLPADVADVLTASEWVIEQDRTRSRLMDPYLEPDPVSVLDGSDWVYETPETADFRRMFRRRRDFELMLGAHPEKVSEDQMAEAWRIAGEDRYGGKLRDAEIASMMGSARNL